MGSLHRWVPRHAALLPWQLLGSILTLPFWSFVGTIPPLKNRSRVQLAHASRSPSSVCLRDPEKKVGFLSPAPRDPASVPLASSTASSQLARPIRPLVLFADQAARRPVPLRPRP
jgi:hypothetical protein